MACNFVIGWYGVSLVMSNLLLILAFSIILCIIICSKNRCSFLTSSRRVVGICNVLTNCHWNLKESRSIRYEILWIVCSCHVSIIGNAPFKTAAAIATKTYLQIIWAISLSSAFWKLCLYSLQSPSVEKSWGIHMVAHPQNVNCPLSVLFKMKQHIEAWADWADWSRRWNSKWHFCMRILFVDVHWFSLVLRWYRMHLGLAVILTED